MFKELLEFIGEGYYDFNLPHANKTLIPNKGPAQIIENFSSSKIGHRLSHIFNKLGVRDLPHKIRGKFYDSKPKLSKKEYEMIRKKLDFEYDYWFSRYPRLRDFWKY